MNLPLPKSVAILDKVADLLANAGALVALVAVFAACTHILVEVVLRAIFNSSTYVVDEIVGYEVGAAIFLAMGKTFRAGALIRVGILIEALKGEWRAFFEFVSVLAASIATAFVAYAMAIEVARVWKLGAVSQTIARVPLWLPKGLLLVGVLILLVTLLARLAVLTTRGASVGSVAGPRLLVD
jgi:TRAP-type C4-dicarboxylate transport system permease small subunit